MKSPVSILVALLVLASCKVAPVTDVRPRLGAEASLVVYLDRLPQGQERLRFPVLAVSARSMEGTEVPLNVLLPTASRETLNRQRMLAGGALPFGPYSGLTVLLGAASLGGPSDGGALIPAKQEVQVDIPFDIGRGSQVTLVLGLAADEAVRDGYRFSPRLDARVPDRSTSGLIGLVGGCETGLVTAFDRTDGHVVSGIRPGRSAAGIVIDSVRLRAYVALPREDAIEVIDLQQYRSIDRIRLRGGDRPVELSLSDDRRTLLAANSASDTLSIVEVDSLSEQARVAVGDEPSAVSFDRTGRLAYVVNTRSDTISVVDLVAGAVASTISTETAPVRAELDRRGERLYVIHRSSPHLLALDTTTFETVGRVYVGSRATALKVDPRTDRIYVSREQSFEIEVYDPFSLLPVDSIRVDEPVDYITIDDQGNNLGLVLGSIGEVHILRLVGKQLVARVDVGDGPCRVAFLGER